MEKAVLGCDQTAYGCLEVHRDPVDTCLFENPSRHEPKGSLNPMKLAVLVRTDLKMGKGKIAGQVGHASVMAVMCGQHMLVEPWYDQGQFKIILKVPDIQSLYKYEDLAIQNGLRTYRVVDFGLTQIEPNTLTCLAIGPAENEDIDPVIGGLALL